MVGAVGNPLAASLDGERESRIFVATRRAGPRHDAVADQPVAEVARRRAGRPGNRMARHALRERERVASIGAGREAIARVPVLVRQVAEAQIGDARAADLAQGASGAVYTFDTGSMSTQLPPRSSGAPCRDLAMNTVLARCCNHV